jgi:S-adenosylmethionine:tRNA ribosyltransferase-isomerase
MIGADIPVRRPAQAKLLAVDQSGIFRHLQRAKVIEVLQPGDLVVANDAATLPASLQGVHLASGRSIEVRLAGRNSLSTDDIHRFTAIVFGVGDFRIRTEDRSLPPALAAGDRLTLGPLRATVETVLNHPRLVQLAFDGSSDEIWKGLARHGRPIQYSHVPTPLALWDVWTPFATLPVAFEPPSAGFALDWRILASIRKNGVQFATITHAAGISSTGDLELDARLPLDEAYFVPQSTAHAITKTRARNRRIIAIGTTVVRALEDAARSDGSVKAGNGLATQRINRATRLRVVDAILSGTHEPGTSHYDLLLAFIDETTLRRVDLELNAQNYRTHEFGDSIFIERGAEKDCR